MTIEEVKEFLLTNKEQPEVKSFLDSIGQEASQAAVNNFKASKEYKEELQREGDRRATGAVEKFQKETMPKHVEEEIKKRFPAETPEQKKVRELEMKLEEIQNKEARAEFKNKAMSLLNEKQLPLKAIDFLNANDDNELLSKIEALTEMISEGVNKGIDLKLKGASVIPAQSKPSSKGQLTDSDLATMKPADIVKAKNEGRFDDLLGRTN